MSTESDTSRLHRCPWAQSDPLLRDYHDTEWGVPVRDSRALWEKLMLDGFQAGLSWLTVLKKREAFRDAFAGFEPVRVAQFDERDVQRLLANPGIIRSRSKIEATIGNARAYLAMQADGEDFATFCWRHAMRVRERSPLTDPSQTPTQSPASEQLSRTLKKRGFRFVGPVIVYAWMQATGMINDHLQTCFRHDEVSRLRQHVS
ncbi:DNA-3-methyladenine glycosylase I [Oleiagrimonas sp. C23AA]|uniref:DNA-3-methyladenine glycosylase I n=1 Tax=Oleiagrimonas sp. C23AA TaxID=2719047 RepID=UPI0031B71848